MNALKLCFLLVLFVTIIYGQAVHVHPSSLEQAESPVAINPTNPNNLVGAAITSELVDGDYKKYIGCYYSINGGENWQGIDDISGVGVGDPVIAFDPDGIAYLLYQNRNLGQLYLHQSLNGGKDW